MPDGSAAISRALRWLNSPLTQEFPGASVWSKSLVDIFSAEDGIPGRACMPKLYDEATEGFRSPRSVAARGLPVLGVGTKPSSSLMFGLYCVIECDREADSTCTG